MNSATRSRSTGCSIRVLTGVAGIGILLACAGTPNQIGLLAPLPRDEMFGEIERKVAELGYTIARADRANGLLVAEKTLDSASANAKEELHITLATESGTMTRLAIVTARVLAGTGDQPERRVAASGRTSADAGKILDLFMKAKR